MTALLKAGLLLAMILLTVISGLAPIWLLKTLRKKAAMAQTVRQQKYTSLILCLLTCFSGGVFLATCFLHLFPELSEHLAYMRSEYGFKFDYPLAELLSCFGFFLLFFLEELVLYLVPSMAHGHSHGGHSHSHGGQTQSEDGNHEDERRKNNSAANHTFDDQSSRLLSSSHHNNENNHNVVSGKPPVEERSFQQTRSLSVEPCKNTTTLILDTTPCNLTECPSTFLPREFAEPELCEINCDRIKEDPPIRMKSRPHAHSHGTRSATIVMAIAFHAIIEGLALGVQEDPAKILAIFISLTVHKLIVAFSVGLQLARTHAHNLHWVVISMVLISLMTPIGGVLGMLVQNAPIDGQLRDTIILICHGLAVGTFLYVTFFEVLIHERDNEHPNLLKLFMMLLGFAFIGLIRLLAESHSHSILVSDLKSGHHHH